MMMNIGTKKVMKMVMTWQRLVIIRRRKRITLPTRPNSNHEAYTNSGTSTSISMAEKGHFVVYTTDSRRFVLPLGYIKNGIFRELLKLAEEEFGLPRNGPLTLPFEAAFMEYLLSLIRRNVDILEKAFLTSIPNYGRCFSSSSCNSLHQEQENPRLVIYGF